MDSGLLSLLVVSVLTPCSKVIWDLLFKKRYKIIAYLANVDWLSDVEVTEGIDLIKQHSHKKITLGLKIKNHFLTFKHPIVILNPTSLDRDYADVILTDNLDKLPHDGKVHIIQAKDISLFMD